MPTDPRQPALQRTSRHPGRSPCKPLPTRRANGAAAPRREERRQPNLRGRTAPRPAQCPRTRSCVSARRPPGAVSPAQAHKDSETGAEKAAFIESMHRSEAQTEVPSPRSGFTRRCPRRSGPSHRGALGGLPLLLVVLRFHGGEEQHLLQTEMASTAPPTGNATSRAQISRELPQPRLRWSAAPQRAEQVRKGAFPRWDSAS